MHQELNITRQGGGFPQSRNSRQWARHMPRHRRVSTSQELGRNGWQGAENLSEGLHWQSGNSEQQPHPNNDYLDLEHSTLQNRHPLWGPTSCSSRSGAPPPPVPSSLTLPMVDLVECSSYAPPAHRKTLASGPALAAGTKEILEVLQGQGNT